MDWNKDILKNININDLIKNVDLTPKYNIPSVPKINTEALERKRKQELEDSERLIRIEKNTDETIAMLKSMWHTLDLIINGMGAASQRATREHIETNNLISQYIQLLQSNEPEKENKLKEFFSKMPMEVALTVIVEVGKAAISAI